MAGISLEFGRREVGLVYKDRPAAFGVAAQGGALALVKVTKPGQTPWFDLPGGAVEAGETGSQAVVREFGEETGLAIEAGKVLDEAAQYFLSDGRPYRNHGPLMAVTVVGEAPELKIEADHELIWMEPKEALRILRHDSHAWAVACWLRQLS